VTVFHTASGRLLWRGDGETLVVEPWGRHSLRVRATRAADVADTDFALLPRPPAEAEIVTEGNVARLTNGNITAVLTAGEYEDAQAGYHVSGCSLAFYDRHGKLLLSELGSGGSLKLKARAYRAIAGGPHHLTASFEARPDEKLYGMGQYQQHMLNLKGCTLELAHRNSQVSVPFLLSSAGYGFLWHNPAIGRATFGANRTEWVAESTRQLDYWITAGDTPADITAAYAEATGHVPMMPEYGLGLWQSKLRYYNQEQLLTVAREYHRRGLPLDVLVADFFHWPKMGDYRFEDEFWPDPDAMVAELRELGIELMVSVWPQVSVESENFRDFRRRNLLVAAERGPDIQMSFQGPSMFLDVTNPAGRAALWELISRNYHARGIRVFWLDEAEPEFGVYDFDNYRYHLGPALEVGNIYPQAFSRAFHEGQRADGQEDVVNLVRCAWAGSQRYGALVWSGDIHCDFDTMRMQITAGINMGIAGIPWFTTDIGGFHGGDIRDPAFHELLVRWFQFGTFCPVMRMHGDRQPGAGVQAADGTPRCHTGAGNELWAFGEEVYDVLVRYLRLREALRPYTRRLMAEAHQHGQPVMRAMFHEFPDDPACWDLADQYMFGGDLLVAPVISAEANSREVYLPAGAAWTDLHTGTRHKGGRHVRVAAPLEVIPVFARDDALTHLVGLV
jgi:alpha-D-xyloside xylohydrolase